MTEANDERPLVIGLTGNIATGKSTVAKMLADLGAHTIDADKVAHQVMRPGTQVHTEIVDTFGSQVLTADGEIDRRHLGRLVFADRKALARLEAIVHPATLEAIERRVAASTADVVVIEAIKLIESGLVDRCDSVWVTTSRPDQQIERIIAQRGMSRAEARQRVKAQRPQEQRVAHADVVIDNSGLLSETREQVVAAWQRVVGEREAGPTVSSWI
jgi:dephospho-CoA kinase